MKTYSLAIKTKEGVWITNAGKYFSLENINFESVDVFCNVTGAKAYGYYYGENSNNMTTGVVVLKTYSE